jgi:hypothetical protein
MSYKVYFSHAFGGKDDNLDHLNKKLLDLYEKHGSTLEYVEMIPVSPVNGLSFAYSGVSYDYGMKMCLDLLSECSLMVIFDGFDNSRGVNIEKEYCIDHDIQIIEYKDYVKSLEQLDKDLLNYIEEN